MGALRVTLVAFLVVCLAGIAVLPRLIGGDGPVDIRPVKVRIGGDQREDRAQAQAQKRDRRKGFAEGNKRMRAPVAPAQPPVGPPPEVPALPAPPPVEPVVPPVLPSGDDDAGDGEDDGGDD